MIKETTIDGQRPSHLTYFLVFVTFSFSSIETLFFVDKASFYL